MTDIMADEEWKIFEYFEPIESLEPWDIMFVKIAIANFESCRHS